MTDHENSALDVCEQIMDAIAGNCCWHPSPDVDTSDWNEDAHVEVTLTIRDCRLLKDVLSKAGRLKWEQLIVWNEESEDV